jgi:hypothetical protein
MVKNLKGIYPLIFAFLFGGMLIIPNFKIGINIGTFENTFLGHENLIEAFNTMRMMLGDRIYPNVVVGEEGWLFYTADRSIDDFQNTNAYSESELAEDQKKFDGLFVQLQKKGIKLVVLIAPDKNTIYPQYLPSQIKKIGKKSRLDQFVNYMQKYGKTPVIDFRTELIEKSKTDQTFYKTDTHWNPLGGYIAYAKIMSVLNQYYPELAPHPLSDYEVVHGGRITFGIPWIMGMPNMKEDFWALQPKFTTGADFRKIILSDGNSVRFAWNQIQNLPSILIYHDSFLDAVIPYLEPHFRQTTSIFRTGVPGIWSINWVDQVHPDIVIMEYVERYLNYDFFIPSSQ